MERDIEKCDASPQARPALHSALDVMAVVSVASALLGAALTAAGTSWRVAAYFSIVGALFDLVFSYEFLFRWQQRRRPFPWTTGISSLLPLLLVSGPFLVGWAVKDLSAAAVRGAWLGAPPASGLSAFAALRLLRVVRPFPQAAARLALTSGRGKNVSAAAAAGLATVMAGAIASDALLIPGFSRAAETRREAAMATILAAIDDEGRIAAASAAEAVALRVDGRVLVSAPEGVSPSGYAVEASGGIEAWFSVAGESKARAGAAAIAALASLAAAGGYALARRRPVGQPLSAAGECAGQGHEGYDDGDCDGNLPGGRPSDRPAGSEELAGILGKRPR